MTLKVLLLLSVLAMPFDANASISGSFGIGYHRAVKIDILKISEDGSRHLPTYLWNIYDIDIGYHFGETRWGIFLSTNRLACTGTAIAPGDGPDYRKIQRTTVALLGRAMILGKPKTIRVSIEGGPCLNKQYIARPSYDRGDDTDKSLGATIGLGLTIPTRFANLMLRMRYIWTNAYRGFNTSGMGASLGIGIGGI